MRHEDAETLEDAMVLAADEVSAITGTPSPVPDMIQRVGALRAASWVACSPTATTHFVAAMVAGRPDLTVEHLVISERFRDLFTTRAVDAARRRLEEPERNGARLRGDT